MAFAPFSVIGPNFDELRDCGALTDGRTDDPAPFPECDAPSFLRAFAASCDPIGVLNRVQDDEGGSPPCPPTPRKKNAGVNTPALF
ncbi:hypothetical protein SPHFLASMR4Y_01444 [Sphingorhabdus sp. SMR4y]|nr:hypothetical protein SPHFLASMR4Y_01444 [Sphingorhabdus sp. SMR4y]